ncbi:hypothetical protein cand_024540 [Cryptosporidium andersoni]|uniref:Transmembrane protein n=1 Tax=Cryptosporidium andersoni TaxID=117008 RepID=A0A1J4MR93_9CRYT|nr:hypothetical protein cand_024540 [Cryptosporidium andersoni]
MHMLNILLVLSATLYSFNVVYSSTIHDMSLNYAKNFQIKPQQKNMYINNDSPEIPVSIRDVKPIKYPRYPATGMRLGKTKSNKQELSRKYTQPLMNLPELNYQFISSSMSRFITTVCIISALPFLVLSLFGDTGDFIFAQFGALSGLFGFLLGLMIFSAVLPDFLTITISVLAGITNIYSTLRMTRVREMPYTSILFFCFIVGNLIYQILAGIPIYTLSPLYTGLSGAVLLKLLTIFGSQFTNLLAFQISLKFFYFLFVLIFGIISYQLLPDGLKHSNITEKQSEDEILRLHKYTQAISSITLTYPVVAFISQMLYISDIFITSPLDPLSFFYIPSQFHITYPSTSILLTIWILLIIFTYLFRTKITNRDDYKPSFVKNLMDHWKAEETH